MEQVLVSKTKDYLILKIPLLAVKKRRVFIDDQERVAVSECLVNKKERVAIAKGLEDFEKGRHSKVFNNAKEAIGFLRSL